MDVCVRVHVYACVPVCVCACTPGVSERTPGVSESQTIVAHTQTVDVAARHHCASRTQLRTAGAVHHRFDSC